MKSESSISKCSNLLGLYHFILTKLKQNLVVYKKTQDHSALAEGNMRYWLLLLHVKCPPLFCCCHHISWCSLHGETLSKGKEAIHIFIKDSLAIETEYTGTLQVTQEFSFYLLVTVESSDVTFLIVGCATTVLVTGAGLGEMVLQLLVGSVSPLKGTCSWTYTPSAATQDWFSQPPQKRDLEHIP